MFGGGDVWGGGRVVLVVLVIVVIPVVALDADTLRVVQIKRRVSILQIAGVPWINFEVFQ